MSAVEISSGLSRWILEIPRSKLAALRRLAAPGEPIADLRSAVRCAFDHPLHLDFPLRRAIAPGDRVALVVDEGLPRLGELIAGVLQYLAGAGVGPESTTIVTAPGAPSSDWIDELPDEFADVHTEVHHPGDRKSLSYLGATSDGRQVYLNRTVIDADQIVVLSGRGYDAQLGYAGCEGGLYPAFSDADTRRLLSRKFSTRVPSATPEGVRAEAAEIAGLLSSTIFVQAIEGAGDTIIHVCAGLKASSADGVRLQDDRWRFAIDAPVDLVLAGVGGDPRRQDFAALAHAAAAAMRAVSPGGCIVILSEIEAELGEGMEIVRQSDDPAQALRRLRERPPEGSGAAAFLWASAAEHARIELVSGLKPEIVEDIFATPICSTEEVQRLIDAASSCLVLPDAHKSLVVPR